MNLSNLRKKSPCCSGLMAYEKYGVVTVQRNCCSNMQVLLYCYDLTYSTNRVLGTIIQESSLGRAVIGSYLVKKKVRNTHLGYKGWPHMMALQYIQRTIRQRERNSTFSLLT